MSKAAQKMSHSLDLADQGDAAAEVGNWAQAPLYYQQALNLWAGNDTALYGMGKCADAAGDTASAISYYRKVVYTADPHRYGTLPGDGYGTNDVVRLMEFVLLLDKAGQKPEALTVYHRAAHLLNYRDADTNSGRPYLKVLLPAFDGSPDALPYTSRHLQAMARVAIAIERGSFGSKEAVTQAQEATRLYPDSPVTNFYLGEQLDLKQKKGAKEAYTKAASLGDDKVIAAAQERLKDLP